MITTCKVGDRYLHDEGYIMDRDDSDSVAGKSRRVEAIVHDREWNEPRSFDMCEVELINVFASPSSEYRRITQYCWTSAGATEGACSDFARPVTDDIQVTRVSLQPKLYEFEPGVFVEWVYGRRPDRDNHLSVHFVCEAEGRQIEGVEVVHRSSKYGRPGSTMQGCFSTVTSRRAAISRSTAAKAGRETSLLDPDIATSTARRELGGVAPESVKDAAEP